MRQLNYNNYVRYSNKTPAFLNYLKLISKMHNLTVFIIRFF